MAVDIKVLSSVPFTVSHAARALDAAKRPLAHAVAHLLGAIRQAEEEPEKAARASILLALREARNDRVKAAALLGVDKRTLFRLLDELNLHAAADRQAAAEGFPIVKRRPSAADEERRARRAAALTGCRHARVGAAAAGYIQPDRVFGFFVRRIGSTCEDLPVLHLSTQIHPAAVGHVARGCEVVGATVKNGWLLTEDGDGAELMGE